MNVQRAALVVALAACAGAGGSSGCHCVARLDELQPADAGASPAYELGWVVQIGNKDRQLLTALAVDDEGHPVVAISFKGTLVLDEERTNFGDEDLAIAKLDGDGEFVWSQVFGEPERTMVTSMVVGPSNAIAFAGWLQGDILIGADALHSTSRDALMGVIDAAGTPKWARTVGGGDSQEAYGVAMSSVSDVIVAGRFEGAPVVSPGAIETGLVDRGVDENGDEEEDGFLLRFDDDGTLRWARNLGGPGNQRVSALARDGDGRLLVAGTFEGTMDLGGVEVEAEGADVFIAALEADGDHIWSGTLGLDEPICTPHCELAVAVGSDHLPVATGAFSAKVDLGTGLFQTVLVDTDVFVARFDRFGEQGSFSTLWAQVLDDSPDTPSASLERPYGLAVGKGRIAVSGVFADRLALGGAIFDNADLAKDLFVVVLDSSGALLWSAVMPVTSSSSSVTEDDKTPHSPKVAFDPDGNLIVAGWFRGELEVAGQVLLAPGGQGDAEAFVAKFAVPAP